MTTDGMLAMRAYGLGHRAASSERIVVTYRINVQCNHNLSTSLSTCNAIRTSNADSDRIEPLLAFLFPVLGRKTFDFS